MTTLRWVPREHEPDSGGLAGKWPPYLVLQQWLPHIDDKGMGGHSWVDVPCEAEPKLITPQWQTQAARLAAGLEEALKLLGHYAMLLNGYDGGTRAVPTDPEQWLERLDTADWLDKTRKIKKA